MSDKKIEVRRPDEDEIKKIGARSWDTWRCETSTFPWEYDEPETCLVLEGRVRVEGRGPDAGVEPVEFGPGDLVTFPRGLKCMWIVSEAVRKHYKFG